VKSLVKGTQQWAIFSETFSYENSAVGYS